MHMDPCNKRYPGRPPRLSRVFDSSPLYYVTFNTWERKSLLANDRVHDAFRGYAQKNAHRGLVVGRYVIMPDHIHLFVREGPEQKLAQYIRLMKQVLTKVISAHSPVERVWQPGFFDHVMRSSESYGEKGSYVRMNPVRAGLVSESGAWMFQGEMDEVCFD